MPEAKFDPDHVGPTEDGTKLAIDWKDGVRSEFVPRYLRQLCPCAGCVDEMTGIRTLDPEAVAEGIYPTAIHYVGRYALQFVWSDGHSTGIYTWDYLRRIWDGGISLRDGS